MINKNTFLRVFSWASLALFVAMTFGCRRDLTEDLGDTALVPITIDWSQSLVNLKETHNVSIWFYPHDGSSAFEYRLEDDLEKAIVPLGVGVYSVIVFNESVDLNEYSDTPLMFFDKESFEKFSVSTKEDNSKSSAFYSKTTDTPLRKTPDVIASWSIDRFEVTWDMVVVTRSRSKVGITKSLSGHTVSSSQMNVVDQELSKTVSIIPLPLVKSVELKANVKNLIAAANVVGRFTGATIAMSLASRKPIVGIVSHTFVMSITNAVWDNPANKRDGTLSTKFWIFDHQPEPKYDLDVNFQLTDGTWIPEQFEVTEKIDKEVVDIVIVVGTDPAQPEDPEPPIVLPNPVSNSVGIDDWSDEIIHLGTKP